MSRRTGSALAALAVTVGMIATGAGAAPARAADPVPLTQRAVAAVMLEHAPTTTTHRQPLFIDKHDPPGTTGADLRYHGGGEYDGDLLRGVVAPLGAFPTTCGGERHCVDRVTPSGEPYLVAWATVVPEEDPGFVFVLAPHGDEYTAVIYAGPDVTQNPITHPLEIPVPTMVAIATDPRLRLLTTQDVVDAGAAVTDWAGGDIDPYRYQRVPQTDLGQVAALVTRKSDFDLWSSPEVSPLTGDFGPGAVGGRVARAGAEPGDPSVVDVLAAPAPPEWLTGRPCATGRFARHCVRFNHPQGPVFLMWRPARDGHPGLVWAAHLRRSQTVAIRVQGAPVPRGAAAVEDLVGWQRLRHDVTYGPIGTRTFKYVVEFDLSVLG